MHMELHLDLRRELNSRCLSLARVRKASRPSIRSQAMRGSASVMGGSELALLDALLEDVGPEVALKVRQLLGTGETVLCSLLEDVLRDKQTRVQSWTMRSATARSSIFLYHSCSRLGLGIFWSAGWQWKM
ncbi:hypothetical protein EYF80_034156 [Liparis tanakae]|uniref:Uncharacterized protein n=1 Tax=Liparis tanakae TaxID=230148 RepID=A0A4Z2GQX1_9TELE|nr:hypothetical protein EYF80_034156 [Liparis tanakae]